MRLALQSEIPGLVEQLQSLAPNVEAFVLPSTDDPRGALPVETIPSFAIAIESVEGRDSDLRRLSTELRKLPRPVIGRIHDGKLLLDLRCLDCESIFLKQLPLLRDALSC